MPRTAKTALPEGTGPRAQDVSLGARIRQLLSLQGMNQTALAEAIGVTYQQVQKYEKGYNRVGYSRLVQISAALGCPMADLIDDDLVEASSLAIDRSVLKLAHRIQALEPELRPKMVAVLLKVMDAMEGGKE